MSHGFELPPSVPFDAETKLKLKFDRRWKSATSKYEAKVNSLVCQVFKIMNVRSLFQTPFEQNDELSAVQERLSALQDEYEQYKSRAHRVLREKSAEISRSDELRQSYETLKKKYDDLVHSERSTKLDAGAVKQMTDEMEGLRRQAASLKDEKNQLEEKMYVAQMQYERELDKAKEHVERIEREHSKGTQSKKCAFVYVCVNECRITV